MSIMSCKCCGTRYDSDQHGYCPNLDEKHTSEPADGSVLSREPDGMGYYYGFVPGDPRQINVRPEFESSDPKDLSIKWAIYIAGDMIGSAPRKPAAETKALLWLSNNPAEKVA
jgi:hypothetical protein